MLRQGAPGVLSVAHAGCLPLPQGISDLTLCTFSLAYLACPFECLSEMARITRKGGAVLVSDLHPASGWERTFRRVGETYAIVHNCHAIAVVKDAARRAGLSLDAEYLASFGEPELPFFRKAGREDLYAKAAAVPAIWAGVWTAP
jgi:ubiquinone/menaquinone biosynthesis C-methylase UbiE